ncbi:hypothetical protein UCRNP2_5504 [Neofusicoccum parvum UCRNP2]|uniref:Uncharacterized protein n=1 Tax=Botryosphaeria parva (strain UCR-NP2) TaxID=1287680 RepID=R1G8A0_BOTPV|nr:hypothetical protein UCRNP2_5504 [Neofusicoccum parvum UCRNP2]
MSNLRITPGQEAAVGQVMILANGPAVANTLPMPDRLIAHRALNAFKTCKDIALGDSTIPQTLIPLWLPNVSFPLFQLKLRDPAQPAAARRFFTTRLKYDYDGPTALLTIRNPTALHTRLAAALTSVLWSNLSRLLARHGRAVPALAAARFSLDERPTVVRGDDAQFAARYAQPIAAALWQPDAAVFYDSDGGAVGAPLLVLEVGGGEKAARLPRLAEGYIEAGVRLVVRVAVGDEELKLTGWDGVTWESGVGSECIKGFT